MLPYGPRRRDPGIRCTAQRERARRSSSGVVLSTRPPPFRAAHRHAHRQTGGERTSRLGTVASTGLKGRREGVRSRKGGTPHVAACLLLGVRCVRPRALRPPPRPPPPRARVSSCPRSCPRALVLLVSSSRVGARVPSARTHAWTTTRRQHGLLNGTQAVAEHRTPARTHDTTRHSPRRSPSLPRSLAHPRLHTRPCPLFLSSALLLNPSPSYSSPRPLAQPLARLLNPSPSYSTPRPRMHRAQGLRRPRRVRHPAAAAHADGSATADGHVATASHAPPCRRRSRSPAAAAAARRAWGPRRQHERPARRGGIRPGVQPGT